MITKILMWIIVPLKILLYVMMFMLILAVGFVSITIISSTVMIIVNMVPLEAFLLGAVGFVCIMVLFLLILKVLLADIK